MDELIKRLNERLAAAIEVQKEHKNSFIDGIISGISGDLEQAKMVKKEGMYNEY